MVITACAECRVIRTLRTLHPAEQPSAREACCPHAPTRGSMVNTLPGPGIVALGRLSACAFAAK
eukprot:scaffold3987_cov118-Isochrysis_galbana.AAC.2